MPSHNITLTTTDEQEAELQLLVGDNAEKLVAGYGAATVEKLVQFNSDQMLNHYVTSRREKRWGSLSTAKKDAALKWAETP